MVADPFAPNCLTVANMNALDTNGYRMWFEGLIAAAFYAHDRESALGKTPEQRFMGLWPDGTPIVAATMTDTPQSVPKA